MMNNTFVSEVIATRLSHDLIGNIGAVANAVELLNEGDDDDKEDISNILNFSSKVLSRRLKYFRLCFGLSNSGLKTLDELKVITEDYLSTLGNPNYPIEVNLQILTPKIYKIVMPAVMMMADIFIKGGKLTVGQTDDALLVSAVSDNPLSLSKLENIKKILNDEEPEENISAYAPLYYLKAYLAESGVMMKIEETTLIIGA